MWYTKRRLGSLRCKNYCVYDDGLENGHWTDYHENGQKAAEGDYVKGKESGKWSYYDENGMLEEEEIYE